jgi:hypothetical protein
MLVKTLETYGKEKGYSLILNRSVVDFSAPGVDISQDLIAKFNEMHKPTANAAVPPKKPEAGKEPPKN